MTRPFFCSMPTLTALVFGGALGASAAERWLAAGLGAAAQDAFALAAALPSLTQLVVATPNKDWVEQAHAWPITWALDAPHASFHFGQRLSALTAQYPADGYLYLGAGSCPLLDFETLAQAVATVLNSPQPLAIANNWHSVDWLVFNCPTALHARPHRLPTDNMLGWVLKHEAGVSVQSLSASAATRFDLDTPIDLALLALHPRTPQHLRQFLVAQPPPPNAWRAAGQQLFTPQTQVALIGRVAPGVWAHVEAHTRAWVRVFSEERGMVASGRQAAGQVQSLVAQHLSQLGPTAFFAELRSLASAAFFDTRVVLAHQPLWPSVADRYAADLGWADAIQDPFLRAFTQALNAAAMPIVCGGHNVVAGGLYALTEIAAANGWGHRNQS